MTKLEFLTALRQKLNTLPREDINRSVDYYTEMIDDGIEDGLSEAEAVALLDPPDVLAEQILAEAPSPKASLPSRRKLRIWEIILLALGSPLWLSLLVAAAAVVLAVYIVIWAVILTCFAIDLALAAAAVGVLFSCVVCAVRGQPVQALVLGGGALVCAGLSIVLFFGCVPAAKGAWRLSRLIWRGIRSLFVRKEEKA